MAFAVPLPSPGPLTPFGTPSHHTSYTTPSSNTTPPPNIFCTPGQQRGGGATHPGLIPPFPRMGRAEGHPSPVKVGEDPPLLQPLTKGYRYNSYNSSKNGRPVTSSPLAQVGVAYERSCDFMDDDEDEDDGDGNDAHQPSSPLGRVRPSTSSSSSYATRTGPRRRLKTPGEHDHDGDEDDEDEDDGPSPLFERRKAQYKSTRPSAFSRARRRASWSAAASLLPLPPSPSTGPTTTTTARLPSSSPPIKSLFGTHTPKSEGEEDPRRAFLRERFKKRYFERAVKAREEGAGKRRGRRHVDGRWGDSTILGKGKGKAGDDDEDVGMSYPNDGNEDDEEEEDNDEILNDELFSRIVANMHRKEQHAYRLSYARDVGSSFDPDIDDVSRWEEELRPPPPLAPSSSFFAVSAPSVSASAGAGGTVFKRDLGSSPPRAPSEYDWDADDRDRDFDPDDRDQEFDLGEWEEEEIEAYAEEYARVVEEQEREEGAYGPEDVLWGLEDVPEEEIFGGWSEGESQVGEVEDVDMDMDL